MERKFYVYVHKKLTTGAPFYVGKGFGRRSHVVYGRGLHWERIVSKHGYIIEIPFKRLPNPCALTIEKALIKKIGRKNLCNKTAGGEGCINPSEETRELMRLRKIGRQQNLAHAQKSRTAKIGKKQPASAIEALIARKSVPIINSDGEIFSSSTEAARQMSARLGCRCSQGNISECARGFRSQCYGLTWSYDISSVPALKPKERWSAIKCKETGEVFPSVGHALQWVKSWRPTAVHQCISVAAREGRSAYGYSWEYKKQ